jgi:hypothetical protein
VVRLTKETCPKAWDNSFALSIWRSLSILRGEFKRQETEYRRQKLSKKKEQAEF